MHTRSWNHITDQIGMFCYTGLSPEQVGRSSQLATRIFLSCMAQALAGCCVQQPCSTQQAGMGMDDDVF